MVVGRVFRRVGNFVGRVHGRVFRALGRLPLVGGAFKALGKFSAAGLGLAASLSPMAMLGLGSYDPGSSFLGGMSQGISGELNPQPPAYQMGNSFNNMYGPPNYGGQQYPGVYGNNRGCGMPPFPPSRPCCCCSGYRGF
jgi:hypothetical protein